MDFLGMYIPMHIVQRSGLLSDLYSLFGNDNPIETLVYREENIQGPGAETFKHNMKLLGTNDKFWKMMEINCRFVLEREILGIKRNDLCKPEDIPEINAIYDLIFDYLTMDY
jgi:hypothetical protein